MDLSDLFSREYTIVPVGFFFIHFSHLNFPHGDIVSGICVSHCYKCFSVVLPKMRLEETDVKIFGDLNLEV